MKIEEIKEAIEKGKKILKEFCDYLEEKDFDETELTVIVASLNKFVNSGEFIENGI